MYNTLAIAYVILDVKLGSPTHYNIDVSYQSYLYKEQCINKSNNNLKPYQIPGVKVLNYICHYKMNKMKKQKKSHCRDTSKIQSKNHRSRTQNQYP